MDKPDVDSIDGLSPAISIDQKTTSKNPRSTVGTVTEINDYLRLLYARVGTPYCVNGHGKFRHSQLKKLLNKFLNSLKNTFTNSRSCRTYQKGTHVKMFERIQKDGYVRVRVDGEVYDISEVPELDKNKKHNIEIVIDRIVVKEGIRSRLLTL